MAVESQENRCDWVTDDQDYIKYHDQEWGIPVHDDRIFFEFLVLEGAQAGLSWLTILKRREAYRRVFKNFDPNQVAEFTENDIKCALKDAGIIRNQLKVRSAVKNAAVFLVIQQKFGSFSDYIWSYVGNKPKVYGLKTGQLAPSISEISDDLSKDLKNRGMSFVGSKIVYAYIQATGLLNDHLVTCFRYKEILKRYN